MKFQMFKLVLKKAEEQEIKLPTSTRSWKSKRIPEKHLFLVIDYAKSFDYVDHNKLWKILKGMGIPDHLTCLLINLFAGQEATTRPGHGTTYWFQIRKGACQAVYCHPAYLTYMQSTSWETLDWKLVGRNINNLRYANDITLMAESREKLKSLLMKVLEESKKVKTQHSET